MILLRACCDCGFITGKARCGYHFYQWWFPLFCTDTGVLSDVSCALPSEERKRINQLSIDLYLPIPHTDKITRQEASTRIKSIDREIRDRFIAQELQFLRAKYAAQEPGYTFDPAVRTALACPQCSRATLVLDHVVVTAYCKADCGLEYRWMDSEVAGCPNCGYRPHRFQTEVEQSFVGQRRTICLCGCSSSTDCISHVDGFCPKCGGLPHSYHVDGSSYCGMHHEKLLPYRAPGNFLFIAPELRWDADQFPNAKHWGDAPGSDEGVASSYCVSCESEHQRQISRAENGALR